MTTKLLRIYTDEAAYFGDRKVLEVVASRARDAGLAGVTVLEALIGFGRSAHMHRRHVLESDRAVVIEIVDEEVRLRAFAQGLVDIPEIGLVTLEEVEVLAGMHASGDRDAGGPETGDVRA
jgi:PII-like signaling protein